MAVNTRNPVSCELSNQRIPPSTITFSFLSSLIKEGRRESDEYEEEGRGKWESKCKNNDKNKNKSKSKNNDKNKNKSKSKNNDKNKNKSKNKNKNKSKSKCKCKCNRKRRWKEGGGIGYTHNLETFDADREQGGSQRPYRRHRNAALTKLMRLSRADQVLPRRLRLQVSRKTRSSVKEFSKSSGCLRR